MSDDLNGIFDNLTPDDFDRSSVRHMTTEAERPWKEWVDENIHTTRVAWLAADGLMNPVAIMKNRDNKTLIFSPDDDETLRQYVQRLTREARKHQAVWFYTTVLTQGGRYTGEPRQIDDDLAVKEAAEQDAMKPCIYFYAEQKNDGNDSIRHGIIAIEGNNTGDLFEAPPEHASPVYSTVLP